MDLHFNLKGRISQRIESSRQNLKTSKRWLGEDFSPPANKQKPVDCMSVYGSRRVNGTYDEEELLIYSDGSARYTEYKAKTNTYSFKYFIER